MNQGRKTLLKQELFTRLILYSTKSVTAINQLSKLNSEQKYPLKSILYPQFVFSIVFVFLADSAKVFTCSKSFGVCFSTRPSGKSNWCCFLKGVDETNVSASMMF